MQASYKTIDSLLTAFKEYAQENPVELEDLKRKVVDFRKISDRDWEVMIRKLVKDGTITSNERNRIPDNPASTKYNEYFITFEGLMLLEMEGGYSGRLQKQQAIEEMQIKLQNKQVGLSEEALKLNTKQTFFQGTLVCTTVLNFLFVVVSVYVSYQSLQIQKNQKSFSLPQKISLIYTDSLKKSDTIYIKSQ